MALDTLPPPTLPGHVPPTPAPPGRHARSRRRRVLRWVGGTLAVLLVAAGGVTWWALDRYVIEHVEIADVDAYEQQVYAERAAGGDATGATGTGGTGTASSTASSTAPVTTERSYTDGDTSITITEVVDGSGNDQVVYYVADIRVGDVTQLLSAFADNEFGLNITQDTSAIAEDNGAVFAVNGDYYGFRETGILIRNGVVYRDRGARTGVAFTLAGEMFVYDERTTTADELLAQGVWQTLSFGPALVDGGAVQAGIEAVEVDTNIGNHSIQGSHPRTGIGMIEANHFVFVVVDGRSSESRGMTMTEFAQVFVDLGATVAYNLDGGGSATMYFNGEVVNNPQGRNDERPTSDILYLEG